VGLRPLRSFLPGPCRRSIKCGRLSWGSLPYGVLGAGSPPSRVCLTRSVPSSGFLNLLTASSSPHRVALFHATDTWGFSLQSISLTRIGSASRRPMPSCRSAEDASLPEEDDFQRQPPSGLCSPCESVACGSLLSSPVARCSPGILPL